MTIMQSAQMTAENKDCTMERKKITLKGPLSREKAAQLEAIEKQKTESIQARSFLSEKSFGNRLPKKKVSELGKTVKFLYKKYPELFRKERDKPLKCGIEQDLFQDLKESTIPHKLIKKALRHYVYSFPYMKALAEATKRYDLEGQPVEDLTSEHRDFAKQWIQDREAEKKA